MSSTRRRAAVYARISEDEMGTAHGVERQVDDGIALINARGWEHVATHTDNDVSALRGAKRPGYEALLDTVRARAADTVVVFHTSRLWRNRRERAEAVELFAAAHVSVTAVKGPDLDLSTASGRGLAGLLGEFDTMESEIKGERVAAAARKRAADGVANGACAYGWRREIDYDDRGRRTTWRDVEDPDTAKVVRSIVERLLSGQSLASIARDLNARGVASPGGKPWLPSGVRKVATRSANVGLREYHRGRPDFQMIPAAWPPIVDRDKHDRVTALFADPRRTVTRPGARQHLLSWGIGRCGVCGGRLSVSLRGNSRYGAKRHLYCCEAGCVGRDEERVDEYVGEVVVARLERPDAAELFSGDDRRAREALDRAEAERARLDLAADQYADGKIDARQLERITAKLRAKIDDAEAEARRARPATNPEAVRSLAAGAARKAWADDEWRELLARQRDDGQLVPEDQQRRGVIVQRRRAMLEALGVQVVINRVARRGPGFDPASVVLEWSR